MKENYGSIIKGILTILIFVVIVIGGFMLEKTRLANTKEMFAMPEGATSCVVSGGASDSASVLYGPQEQKQLENKFGKVKPELLPTPTPVPVPPAGVDKSERIVSYFQGSASWKSKLIWSGDWGTKEYKEKNFGAFGCGLCAMANIYSSLTPYYCSPLDMYNYAKKNSGYRGAGAIEWWNMRTVLEKTGFSCEMGKKPKDYKEFQRLVSRSKAMIILVSNHNKKSMWKNTTGHYAAIFLYDPATDKVFLTDSGSYERNRKWVPLKKIYQSLKTISDYQYLSVTSYEKKNDTWKNTEFTGNCNFPPNWRTE